MSSWEAGDENAESVKLHNNAWVNNALLLIAGEQPVALAALIYAQPLFSVSLSPSLAFCCLLSYISLSLFLSLPLVGYVRLFSRHCTPHPPLAVACKQERAAESSESRSAGSSALGSGRSARIGSTRLGSARLGSESVTESGRVMSRWEWPQQTLQELQLRSSHTCHTHTHTHARTDGRTDADVQTMLHCAVNLSVNWCEWKELENLLSSSRPNGSNNIDNNKPQ